MKTVIRFAVDLWSGSKLVIPLIGILLCTWLLVSLITSGATFRDALALGVSGDDLTQGELTTRYMLLIFFVLFSIAYTGQKLRAAIEHEVCRPIVCPTCRNLGKPSGD